MTPWQTNFFRTFIPQSCCGKCLDSVCGGGEFGMGAEIGFATVKLHARGPSRGEQLTSFKYLVTGNGTVAPLSDRKLTVIDVFSLIDLASGHPVFKHDLAASSANSAPAQKTMF